GASGADRGGVLEVPRAGLVQEVLRDQRAHRAQVDDVSVPVRAFEALLEEGVDDRSAPALHDREARLLLDLVHEAHAARAHDAAVPVEEDVTTEIVPPEDALGLAAASVIRALRMDVVLEVALAGPIADRPIQRRV